MARKLSTDIGLRETAHVTQSNAVSLDSATTQSVTIAHGLSYTPNVNECMVVMLRNTNVADFIIAFIRVVSTDATNVTVEVRVSTASGTAGAKGDLILWVIQ